jgi:alpha-tubulin suppressor-like RCC1 family protein
LDGNGAAYCWGANDYGQLGDGSTSSRTTPTAVVGGFSFQSLSAGYSHACGVTGAGAAYCWGRNASGQLGDGTTTDRPTPSPVAGGLAFRSVAAGAGHSCALTSAGAAYCWGRNDGGQLGDSTTVDRLEPVAVAGGISFQSIVAGGSHSCGLTAAGVGSCWGDNCCGELGIGPSTPASEHVSVPTPILGGLTFRSITAEDSHTCGVTTTGDAYCWGSDIGNLVGTGALGFYVPEPMAVVGSPLLLSLTTGSAHTCGLTTSGVAYCWGDWSLGQLAVGRPRPEVCATSPVPVAVP